MRDLEDLFNASDEEKAELTDSEVQEIAFRVASDHLAQAGYPVLGLELLEDGLVAIRFKHDGDDALCFVDFGRHPNDPLPMPSKPRSVSDEIKAFWLGINLANEMDAFDPKSKEGMRLMRGFGLLPKISELVSLSPH